MNINEEITKFKVMLETERNEMQHQLKEIKKFEAWVCVNMYFDPEVKNSGLFRKMMTDDGMRIELESRIRRINGLLSSIESAFDF